MAKLLLGVNCNCFTNRYTEPREWTRICSEELGLGTVQYCIDLLDPYYPWDIQRRICDETLNECEKRGIRIKANFGGHFSHQHYLGHPDEDIRRESEKWFMRMIDQTAYIGAEGTGTCFAIMTTADNDDAMRRRFIMEDALEAYGRLCEYAAGKGLSYLMFETTSIARESCSTIAETKEMLDRSAGFAVPLFPCLDVGHRSLESNDPRDANPLEWIREFRDMSPVIHIQQTDDKASRHWPFIDEYNTMGIIDAGKVAEEAAKSTLDEVLLAFELGAKAFYPAEYEYMGILKESVRHWREYVKD